MSFRENIKGSTPFLRVSFYCCLVKLMTLSAQHSLEDIYRSYRSSLYCLQVPVYIRTLLSGGGIVELFLVPWLPYERGSDMFEGLIHNGEQCPGKSSP